MFGSPGLQLPFAEAVSDLKFKIDDQATIFIVLAG
jgi:hypothetical protein